MTKDYYEILNIPSDANESEVHRAYEVTLSDLNLGKSGKSLNDIEEAYWVLSNPETRLQYDHIYRLSSSLFKNFDGLDASKMVQANGSKHGQVLKDQDDVIDFDDPELVDSVLEKMQEILADLKELPYDKQLAHSVSNLNLTEDIFLDLKLTASEVKNGGYKNIDYTCFIKCSDCNGLGSKHGGSLEVCVLCGGTISVRNPCLVCAGLGKYPRENCPKCMGQGRVLAIRKAEIKLPPKVRSNTILKVAKQGNYGFRNLPNSDLVVRIKIKN